MKCTSHLCDNRRGIDQCSKGAEYARYCQCRKWYDQEVRCNTTKGGPAFMLMWFKHRIKARKQARRAQ